jgi:hypothetical protein
MNITLKIKKCTDSFTTIGFWTQKASLSLLTLGFFAIPIAAIGQIPRSSEVKKTEIVSTKVEDDNVTLRVKVTGEGNKPITDLSKEDFKLRLKDIEDNQIIEPKIPGSRSESNIPFDWISAQETTPPPVYIIFLLDASGSMRCPSNPKDIKNTISSDSYFCQDIQKGKRKWDEAVSAIQVAKNRGGNTTVNTIEFGFTRELNNCNVNNQKTLREDLSKKFYNVSDAKHTTYLNNLKNKDNEKICQETNIYDSLIKSVEFFKYPPTTELKNSFYPLDKEKKQIKPKPRLSIFLLTDGTDTEFQSPRERDNKLNEVKTLVGNNSQISIHALGYGLTQEELNSQPKLSKPDLYKVDKDEIDKIGKITQGIGMTAKSPNEVAEKLNLFLSAVLGEYEIKYIQPKAVRGRAYNISVSAQGTKSSSQEYRILNFGRVASGWVIGGALVLSVVLGAIWWFSHCHWRQKLLEES